MTGRIIEQRSNSVATLLIANEAKRNALDLALLEALRGAAVALAGDTTVRVVVLRGAGGKAFSAGADFAAFSADSQSAFDASFQAMATALEDCITALSALPQPLIAALDGPCFGGAVQVALAADIRIASDAARLAIPAARLGIVYPADAIMRLEQLIGTGRCRLALLTGRAWTASEAYRDGLLDLIVSVDGFEAELLRLATELLAAPAATLTAYKQILDAVAQGQSRPAIRAIESAANARSETWQRLAARNSTKS